MVFERRGFESTTLFFGDCGIESISWGGGGGFFKNFVLFGWSWWFDFDFLGDYFFKGIFFSGVLCWKFIYICGESLFITSQNRFNSQPVQPSSVLKLISKKIKTQNQSCTPSCLETSQAQIYADCLLTSLFIPTAFETDRP